jgi:hypothetical protein
MIYTNYHEKIVEEIARCAILDFFEEKDNDKEEDDDEEEEDDDDEEEEDDNNDDEEKEEDNDDISNALRQKSTFIAVCAVHVPRSVVRGAISYVVLHIIYIIATCQPTWRIFYFT